MTLLTTYTVAILGYYVIWKLKFSFDPKSEIKRIKQETPSLRVLEFEPKNGSIKSYVPGNYFFIRSKNADITTEGHPFSAKSAKTSEFSNSIELMSKEVGDWTGFLQNVNVRDNVTWEGLYGNFFPNEVQESKDPFVLLAGGIGLTPNLSILRHEHEKNSNRRIHPVWSWRLKKICL